MPDVPAENATLATASAKTDTRAIMFPFFHAQGMSQPFGDGAGGGPARVARANRLSRPGAAFRRVALAAEGCGIGVGKDDRGAAVPVGVPAAAVARPRGSGARFDAALWQWTAPGRCR